MRRILIVGVPMAALGFVLATLGLGLLDFYVAGALASPSVLWILREDLGRRRRRGRSPPRAALG
ncbi:MAG TPA: hypothetical protein VHF89_15455 [Solirubrobacteraceae bacterium]|nr:hypothetical protein [Solirubrobacteraceae bacterium]